MIVGPVVRWAFFGLLRSDFVQKIGLGALSGFGVVIAAAAGMLDLLFERAVTIFMWLLNSLGEVEIGSQTVAGHVQTGVEGFLRFLECWQFYFGSVFDLNQFVSWLVWDVIPTAVATWVVSWAAGQLWSGIKGFLILTTGSLGK